MPFLYLHNPKTKNALKTPLFEQVSFFDLENSIFDDQDKESDKDHISIISKVPLKLA